MARMSAAQYLSAPFEDLEPEFVDGEVVERAMPDTHHSRTVVLLADAFQPYDSLFRAMHLRLRLREECYRVVDFAVFDREPESDIPEFAPVVVVEVVSPDDTYETVLKKSADYEAAGVAYVYWASPRLRLLSRYSRRSLAACEAIEMPEYGLSVPASAIFG